MNQIPKHLHKYIVDQNYEKYTPVDQAVWRYILRQLRKYLSIHAHETYLEGLEKTGIDSEEIPKIEEISKKLNNFGWRAIPVSGFIPPAAFMELQSLSILPIASDLRTLDHLLYTPAPDIVHEAAGHAPILIHPEFSAYLKQYSQVAKKAIISKEDMNLYEAIRVLSDLKENPESTKEEIEQAEKKLDQTAKNMSHISEASLLSRMNWWTAEYGLIGDINNPKIYGAGLLSSVGESKWCLSNKVKKIPLTVDCINTSYDITEPQPQLFVTPDFKTLTRVLDEMANLMAFRKGGTESLEKAKNAGCVTTTELNSGLQISGVLTEYNLNKKDEIIYLKTSGPTQLSYNNLELKGHSNIYHKDGFSCPIGFLKNFPDQCPSTLNDAQISELGIVIGKKIFLEYTSGITVNGLLKNILKLDHKILLLTLEQATVKLENKILFAPSWGIFDLALGSSIPSVFGGPADRAAYGEVIDFVAARVPNRKFTENEKSLHQVYQQVRDIRNIKIKNLDVEKSLTNLFTDIKIKYKNEWLLAIEILEILYKDFSNSKLISEVESFLNNYKQNHPLNRSLIDDGVTLAQNRF